MGMWAQDLSLEGKSGLKKGQGPCSDGRLLLVASDYVMTLGIW